MQIADSFTVKASLDEVWRFLFDIEQMSQCVPGVEEVRALDDRTYQGVIRQRLGPVQASFRGVVTLAEIEPPGRLVATIQAEDKGMASAVKTTFTSTLKAIPEGTQVDYLMEVNLRGRLAQFGAAVVRATAKKMTQTFADNLRAQLET